MACYGAGVHLSRPHHRYTYDEYLRLEEDSPTKHEFFDGEIYAMAGGTPEHAALAAALIELLGPQLREHGCRLYTSDLRVRVMATGLSTYPDVTIICGPSERDPAGSTSIVNPKVIIEVLSDGTEAYDRGEKLEHYQQIPALAACILVSHRERLLELWSRSGGRWVRTEARAGGALVVGAVPCTLDVDALYDRAAE
jgi:Uma2 family endonuclease